ncbi:MAG: dehydrogenase E1 component subunit alpha/beta [Gemmatimonadota bacterium]|jgi:2-oxoisovalerate dehydrogenase E1 component|nr:dehydrogenase E1 component subunit alpha/beta [Gemmatimonadota bacterium]
MTVRQHPNPDAVLSRDDLLLFFRNMVLSRAVDDEEIRLKRKNLIFFQISGAGHEAVLTAIGHLMRPGSDWFFPYYRDRALCLMLGMTPEEMLQSAVAASTDPNSHGRQMPSHWGHRRLNIVSQSSPTGSQVLHAVGCAEAGSLFERLPGIENREDRFHEGEVSYASLGDGTTSQGEFWEGLNTASVGKLPVLFHVEDNGYAISTPVEHQTPGGSISAVLASYPGLRVEQCDGTDPVESHRKAKELLAHIRAGEGPGLLHSQVTRPYSHSLSDDHRAYRDAGELEQEAARDCIATFSRRLIDDGTATQQELDEIRAEATATVEEASARAQEAPKPKRSREEAAAHLYSPAVDPTGPDFDSPPSREGEPESIVGLVNRCLAEEMERNPGMVVFGEDVADASREHLLSDIPGKGGVFKVTHGLQTRFGGDRVFNSPLAEANIVGRAVGMAVRGIKPVVEIQFFDYVWPAMMQIRNELAMMRWRSGGEFACPVVIRIPIGGYLQGGAVYHSQSGESIFAHCPGLRVAFPSNALDASGLLRTAIRCEDPVLFLEHKHIYRQPYAKGPLPDSDHCIPFGRARTHRPGTDLTLVTWGALVRRSEMAAARLSEEGIEVEILDLRTIAPWDFESVAESVKRTNRCLVVHEDHVTCGFGAEVAARVADDLFPWLDAPVRRVAGMDTPVAYSPALEDMILPQVQDVIEGARQVATY